MIRKELSDVLNFIAKETISASELQAGDIISLRSCFRFIVVTSIEMREDNWNHGNNLEIISLNDSRSYVSPTENVSIIKRDIVDKQGLLNYIQKHLEEVEEYNRICEQEEKEELEREKEYLRERLEALGD